METLAIIAYRQPVTTSGDRIDPRSGLPKPCSSTSPCGALVSEVARQETPGHPRLFGTTLRFLQLVGLERIEDLPAMAASAVLPNFEWTAHPPERLNRFLARRGVASRRGADELIAGGRVTVNGEVSRLGAIVDPSVDRVSVDGYRIPARAVSSPSSSTNRRAWSRRAGIRISAAP